MPNNYSHVDDPLTSEVLYVALGKEAPELRQGVLADVMHYMPTVTRESMVRCLYTPSQV
jgi:hypothetical protein